MWPFEAVGAFPGCPAATGDAVVTFVDPVPEDYLCHICLNAARDAMVTEQCGHLFCKECITRAIDIKAECPIDRLPLTSDLIRKDIRAQRRIQSFKVYCSNRESGCSWMGDLSNFPGHLSNCDFCIVKCPFEEVGCSAVVTSKTYDRHMESAALAHSLVMCKAITTLKAECAQLRSCNTAYQRMLLLSLDSDYFLWSLPDFKQRHGAEVSKIFKAKGLNWYMKVDFDESLQYSALYLYASAHAKRVTFEFLLFNVDAAKDEVLHIDDWHPDFKGKGWGNKRFIDRLALAASGFVIDGRVTVGVRIVSEPF
eukprot:GGOE01036596.1.p1 GENE.GGOE01036596.1~~GGOE01036596.1.p1  ORF type:complete len:356 (+),score=84.51 GGOE01036596.1:141-1070(+)